MKNLTLFEISAIYGVSQSLVRSCADRYRRQVKLKKEPGPKCLRFATQGVGRLKIRYVSGAEVDRWLETLDTTATK